MMSQMFVMTRSTVRAVATTAAGFPRIANAHSVSGLCLARAPSLEPLAYRRGRCDMTALQAAEIPLMETELLRGLDLRQAQDLTSALEAYSQCTRVLYQSALGYLMLLKMLVLLLDR